MDKFDRSLNFITRTVLSTLMIQFLIITNHFGQGNPYRHYTVEDGLSSNTVYELVQDNKGFIWFATSNGVSRFDGKNFTNFSISDGLSDNDILRIFKDSNGILWLSGFNGTVSIVENNIILNGSKLPLLARLNSDFFYVSYFEKSSGEIVIGNHQNSSAVINFPDKVTIEKSKKEIVFKTIRGYIDLHEGFYVKPEGESDSIFVDWKTNPVLTHYNYADSLLLLNTRNGLLAIDKNHRCRILDLPEGILTESSKVFCDADLNLWVTSNIGVSYLKHNNKTYRLFRKYFPDYNITSVFRDSEQNVWIGTHGNGVYMLPSNFEMVNSYTTDNGIWNNESYAVLKDRHGRLWVGHGNAMLDIIDKTGVVNLRLHDDPYTISRALHIQEHPNGTIIVGSDMALFYIRSDEYGKVYVNRQLFWNSRQMDYKTDRKV